jgi:hypothetical protein
MSTDFDELWMLLDPPLDLLNKCNQSSIILVIDIWHIRSEENVPSLFDLISVLLNMILRTKNK